MKQIAAQGLAHLKGWSGQQGVLAELSQFLDRENQNALPDQPEHPPKIPRSQCGEEGTREVEQQQKAAHIDEHADQPEAQLGQMRTQQWQQPAESCLGGFQHRVTLSMLFRDLLG